MQNSMQLEKHGLGNMSQWWRCLQWAKKILGGVMDAIILFFYDDSM